MASDFHAALVDCWGSWAPTVAPSGDRFAFISDRGGVPGLWVQDIPSEQAAASGAALPDATPIALSEDPVIAAHWSPDGEWLACSLATDGGVRTQVWVVRPDGRDARRVAGDAEHHAILGHWSRRGHRLIIEIPPTGPDDISRCVLFDPATGESEPLAEGGLVSVLDLTADERFALLRDGKRGAHFCLTLDRALDQDHPLLPYPDTGSTEYGILRPSPIRSERQRDVYTAYLITDAARPRAVLAAVAVGWDGVRGEAGILAERVDGELEFLDADDDGTLLLLVWNVDGRSIIELIDTSDDRRHIVDGLPGQVVTSCVLARDGRSAVFCVEGPYAPRRLWRLDVAESSWRPLTHGPDVPLARLIEPTLETFTAHDGLPLTGWLYRAAQTPGPAMLSLHGGPEAQERPVFSPQHQAMAAAGISVFAPNVRGSSGFGRAFAHADDRFGRFDAIDDVRSAVVHLTAIGVAEPGRVAVTGRSYGGYLTLAALVRHAEHFAAGVDICGMSDLLTFYRDTEPWIAAAAVTKYGDPQHDYALLRELSPLRHADVIGVPLMVVHGELDTNVPLNEARQVVAAVRAAGGRAEYLELAGEGHEYRRRSSRLLLIDQLAQFLTDVLGVRTTAAAS